jgi:putative transposase
MNLDPGVRTFLTGFEAETGNVYEWGKNDASKLCRLQHHADKLQSQINQKAPLCHHRRRKRLRKARARIHERIKNLTTDLHRKCAKWLCSRYSVILLPKFNVQGMVEKKSKGRRIGKRTVRAMLALRHYTFRDRLLSEARKHPGVRVLLVNEAFTSKTCGNCGWIHKTLGGNKDFRCRECGIHMDRDVNGARNVLLRFLGNVCSKKPLVG